MGHHEHPRQRLQAALQHNGDRPWTAPVNVADLIESTPSLGRYALNFEYFKIVEHEFSREQLLGIRNVVSALVLAEAHYDIEMLTAELPSLFARAETRQAGALFLNWFYQLRDHGRMPEADYVAIETAFRSVEEARTMLITALEKERAEIERRVEQGMEKGIEQGIDLERRTIVAVMHARGFASSVIADLVGLTVEEVDALLADEQQES